MPDYRIRACAYQDIPILTETIRNSFRDVAERFCLTRENAPHHPSNCSDNWIRFDMERGVRYFIAEHEHQVAGCVAVEQAASGVCYLERLAVLPGHRRRGLGRILVDQVLSKAGELGADCVSIGIIDEHAELKSWYKKIGFVEGESRKFSTLPFLVTFMSYTL